MRDEDGRNFVFEYLKINKGKKYTISSLFTSIQEEHPETKITRYKLTIYIEHLIALKKIKYFQAGYKVVWYE